MTTKYQRMRASERKPDDCVVCGRYGKWVVDDNRLCGYHSRYELGREPYSIFSKCAQDGMAKRMIHAFYERLEPLKFFKQGRRGNIGRVARIKQKGN